MMEAVLGCSGGPLFGGGVDRLGASSPSVHGPCFLDPTMLAPVCGRT